MIGQGDVVRVRGVLAIVVNLADEHCALWPLTPHAESAAPAFDIRCMVDGERYAAWPNLAATVNAAEAELVKARACQPGAIRSLAWSLELGGTPAMPMLAAKPGAEVAPDVSALRGA